MLRHKRVQGKNALPESPPQVDNIAWASQSSPSAIEWLLPGAVQAGAICLIEGRKGVGKSSVMASIVAAITGGPTPPGWIGPRDRRALWWCGEEHWESMVLPRLLGAGAPAERVGWLAPQDHAGRRRAPVLPMDVELIREIIVGAEIGLLVIDGYGSVLNSGASVNQDQQVRQAWEPLAEVLAQTHCTCITSRHLRKGTSGDVTEHGSGSGAILNLARVSMRADKHPSEKGVFTLAPIAVSFGRALPTQRYRLVPTDQKAVRVDWLGDCDLDAETIAEGRGSEAERDEWADADRLLATVIGPNWVQVNVIITESERAGIGLRTVRRAKARLQIPSRRVAYGGEGYWEWGPPSAGWPDGLTGQDQVGGISPPSPAPLDKPKRQRTKKPRKSPKVPKEAKETEDTPNMAKTEEESNGEQ